MKTPTQSNQDALVLIRTLAAGKTATVTLACGNPHRFEPRDLLRNQEAVLLFAGIEQVLDSYAGGASSSEGNVELSAALGVPPMRVPSLSNLIEDVAGELPGSLLAEIRSLKKLRNEVLHGFSPLFIPDTSDRIRKLYEHLVQCAGLGPSAKVARAIDQAQAALRVPSANQGQSTHDFLSDLLEMVDVERSLRNHLVAHGMKVDSLKAVECAHELLKHLNPKYLPKGLVVNLRKVFILRNLMAHGVLLTLTSDHKALIRKTSADMHSAISGTNLAKQGGKMTLGDGFTNGALALGLAAVSLG